MASCYNFKKAKAIEKANKERLTKSFPSLNGGSGVYFMTRIDENGFKYAYIGQSNSHNGILSRCAQHLVGYKQHIDRSLQKYKLYDEKENPFGWKMGCRNYPDKELDNMEQLWIKKYADAGYQLRNVSLGGQGEGRNMINETKPAKGYREGVAYGKKQLAKELSHIIDLHLNISLKKPDNKVSQKALEKFYGLLDIDRYKE